MPAAPPRSPPPSFTSWSKRPRNASRAPSFPASPASTASATRWRTPSTNSPPPAATAPASRTCLPDAPLGDAFLAVYQEVDRELARRGLAMRARRLELAAAQIAAHGLNGIETICMDGFHALPDPELRVVAAMGRHADLTLTLGDEDLTPALRTRLAAMGFTEERLRCPPRPSRDRARQGARHRARSRRDRPPHSSSGRLGTSLPRDRASSCAPPRSTCPPCAPHWNASAFPARFYFDTPLERHAVVRFLSGAVDAMLGGWDHARTLAVLRLAPRFADFPMADRFDFDVREQIPNAGLSELRSLLLGEEGQPRPGAERLLHKLDSLAALEEWRAFVLTPKDWAARFSHTAQSLPPGAARRAGHARARAPVAQPVRRARPLRRSARRGRLGARSARARSASSATGAPSRACSASSRCASRTGAATWST